MCQMTVLRGNMPVETRIIGYYADDVKALIATRKFDTSQLWLSMTMRRVKRRMRGHGLSLAFSKTKRVVLT